MRWLLCLLFVIVFPFLFSKPACNALQHNAVILAQLTELVALSEILRAASNSDEASSSLESHLSVLRSSYAFCCIPLTVNQAAFPYSAQPQHILLWRMT
jgi:hypothetical protein